MSSETIGTGYIQIEPSAKGISGKIQKEMSGQGAVGGKAFNSGFGQVIGGITKATTAAVAAGATAVGGLVTKAVQGFGNYEQLIGGVETLYGNAYDSLEDYAKGVGLSLEEASGSWEDYQKRQDAVIENAQKAYMTAGLSTNEYMETVNSFAAALNSSLGEYAWQSANYADMAVTDMADNANKMGTSMESIQNAYQGFAKGNFTMLDNLKLGYGGTKGEMERLLRKAEELEGYMEGSLSIDSFADIVDAIHIVQEDLGIAGTTADEASKTIQGSLAAMASAWNNLVAGMGTSGADLSGLIDNLVESVKTFVGNVQPVVETSLKGVSQLIAEIAPVLATELPGLLASVLPMLLDSGVQIIQTLGEGILTGIPELMPAITDVALKLTDMLITMLPQLTSVGIQVILQLSLGIAQALPDLIPTIVSVVLQIVDTLTDNADLLVDAAISLMIGLTDGLINALPILIEKVPLIAVKVAESLIENIPVILAAVVQCNMKVLETIASYVNPYAQAAGSAAQAAVNAVVKFIKDLPKKMAYYAGLAIGEFIKFFKELPSKLTAVWNSILNSLKQFGTQFITQAPKIAKEFGTKLIDELKNLPKKCLEIGKQIVDGIFTGIKNGWGDLKKKVKELIEELLKGVKDGLKIKSPSKVFADEVGAMIPLGIAEGIKKGMSSLNAMADGMTMSLVSSADGMASSVDAYSGYVPDPARTSDSMIYSLLAEYLPELAKGVTVKVEMDADAGRLYRIMKIEQAKNEQLVGA